MIKLPSWLRQELPGRQAEQISRLIRKYSVNTVCKEAACPNSGRCFGQNSLTFMILGDICTRNCKFCNVNDPAVRAGLKPALTDKSEPDRIAALIAELGLDYAVITSVTRDDLDDGGAEMFSLTTKAIRSLGRDVNIELLIPDFQGSRDSVRRAVSPAPDVCGHNMETVSRLYAALRPQADYRRSLEILGTIKKIDPGTITKSSLMLGLGEEISEVVETMHDLRAQDCDSLVLGQYLAPSAEHYPVKEFIRPGQFEELCKIGLEMGFRSVLSHPLARSSYRAKEIYQQIKGTALCMN